MRKLYRKCGIKPYSQITTVAMIMTVKMMGPRVNYNDSKEQIKKTIHIRGVYKVHWNQS